MLLASALLPDAPTAIACLVVAFVGIGLFTANVWAITQTLAGPDAAGSWTGWQNAFGNMGGVVAPIVTGWTVSASGSYIAAFVVAAVTLLGSAACYGLLLPRAASEAKTSLATT
jgi:nitrate/nitrite transporter NarK